MAARQTRSSESPFAEFLEWYSARQVRRRGRPASPRTLQTKHWHLKLCAQLVELPDPGCLWMVGQDPNLLNSCLEGLHARMTPGSVRGYVYTLSAYFEWAQARGLMSRCVFVRDDIPAPNPLPAITVYSREEVEAFISASRGVGLRWWAFVTFMADTGRRVGEALDLRWTWFQLRQEPAYVELPRNKSGKPQYVPLTRRLTEEVFTEENISRLMSERPNGRRVYKRDPREHPFPWEYNSVYKRLRHFCEVTGLPMRGWHCFRHTLITERLAQGVPMHIVAKLAGHSSVTVTQTRYDHTDALAFARYVERDWDTD